jgi:hypothetical protein
LCSRDLRSAALLHFMLDQGVPISTTSIEVEERNGGL